MTTPDTDSQSLPCVVQLGFAGSRRLFTDPGITPEERVRLIAEVERYLREKIKRLPRELHFESRHFLCGISQIAIGADTLFTRVCKDLNIPQRLFLPWYPAEYLAAIGADGPDFSDDERAEAETLLASPHIIQKRVVSDAEERAAAFEDANLEILSVSDVVVCLIQKSKGRPGGTAELLERARKRGVPALEIEVGRSETQPTFKETWYGPQKFPLPKLPSELVSLSLPSSVAATGLIVPYRTVLGNFGRSEAKIKRSIFERSTLLILVTHFFATALATAVLALHPESLGILTGLLGTEVVLLIAGFSIHMKLHSSKPVKVWALSRLVREIIRSIEALPGSQPDLNSVFSVQLPENLRPLLRTLNVLYMRGRQKTKSLDWKEERTRYLEQRIQKQRDFFSNRVHHAGKRLSQIRHLFVFCSVFAMLATSAKLGLAWIAGEGLAASAGTILGILAVLLPLVAVSGLSISAAQDYEALEQTYSEMKDFLDLQVPAMEQATTEREFLRLLVETEARLLGETATWFSRRFFKET